MNNTTFTKADIKRALIDILLNSTFADTIDWNAKIRDIITFDEDTNMIKEKINEVFGMSIIYDISNTTVNELFTIIYGFICNSGRIKSNAKRGRGLFRNPDVEWNRKLIFAAVMNRFRGALGRNVATTESLDDIKYEISGDIMGVRAAKFYQAIKDLEKFFDIKIYDNMRVYNIANAAEESMIKSGKMRQDQPKPSATFDEQVWQKLIKILPVNFLESVIKRDFGAHITGYQLAGTHSFDEFVQKVREAQKKNTVHMGKQK